MTFKLISPELEGDIYYLTEQEGGRTHYLTTGYRGQFYYNGRDWDAPQEFIDKDICNLGETVKVRLQTLSPDFHIGQFWIGQEFEIREGSKTVGKGRITQILRQDFNYWDFESFFNQLPNDCKPYDFPNIGGFIADIRNGLDSTKQFKSLKFTKSLSDKNLMLKVECTLKDNNISARPLVDELCKSWREMIQFKTSLYKTNLNHLGNGFKFELTFATWQRMYLTGKIIVNTTKQ